MLHCVAGCCRVLQGFALYDRVLQCAALPFEHNNHSNPQRFDLFRSLCVALLQCGAECWSVLQCLLKIPISPILSATTFSKFLCVSHFLLLPRSLDVDDCFYYHSWRSNVVIAFGTLWSFSFLRSLKRAPFARKRTLFTLKRDLVVFLFLALSLFCAYTRSLSQYSKREYHEPHKDSWD